MPLSTGTRLGPYEILAPIGAGGMGEVYRARDIKLDREVAVKVLPAALAQDSERLSRFEREAKVLASLNHPNIATIHGVEESGGVRALVMELVAGENLKGPLPVEMALNYARQIADALEAAHEKGIIHRDLKPANIMITPAGVVKVLDFGLAAVTQSSDPSNPANSPTLTISPTRAGMILGTAAYMSPEQARGKAVDKRADIWAFGVVLYEMLTGKRLFEGETISDTLAAVLKTEPDLAQVPAKVRRLLEACLQKDPKQRLQAIGDWRLLLTDDQPPGVAPTRSQLGVAGRIAAAILLLALGALSFVHFRKAPPPEARSVRFQVRLPEKSTGAMFRLSPDGRYLAIAGSLRGNSRLWVRPLDSLESRPLPGTEGADIPFWSPDSAFIGFYAQGKLKRVALSGGPPQNICDATLEIGGTWNHDGVIVFTPDLGKPLHRVPASGGVAAPVTTLAGAVLQAFPQFLPGGDRFLYLTIAPRKPEVAGVYVGSLDKKPPVRILASGLGITYVPSTSSGNRGHLLFLRGSTLTAQAFDPQRLRLSGEMVPLAEPVGTEMLGDLAAFSVSDNGVLAYSSGQEGASRELVWLDRTGKQIGSVGPPGEYNNFRLSPDEKRIVIDRSSAQSSADIWVLDILRGVTSRLTFDPAINDLPIWSPDGLRVLFPSNRKGSFDLYIKAASGAGQEEPLVKLGTLHAWATDWSRDGRFILYEIPGVDTGQDLWIAPLFGDRKPFPYLRTQFNEGEGAFSPDGRWIAYVSDESGRDEIYVQAFPPSGEKRLISTGGGSEPYWRKDGMELFYVAADRNLMAVPIKLGTTITPGTPKSLFPVPLSEQQHSFAVTGDGQRFLVSRLVGEMPPITVVLNWEAALKK
jgi:Tol biopolymer transport system component